MPYRIMVHSRTNSWRNIFSTPRVRVIPSLRLTRQDYGLPFRTVTCYIVVSEIMRWSVMQSHLVWCMCVYIIIYIYHYISYYKYIYMFSGAILTYFVRGICFVQRGLVHYCVYASLRSILRIHIHTIHLQISKVQHVVFRSCGTALKLEVWHIKDSYGFTFLRLVVGSKSMVLRL